MTTTRTPLAEIVRLFLRLGFTAFGGPAAHISMMHDEVVTRARAVAEAQGGFLSFGRVSQSEEAVLRRLEAALTG